MLFPRSARLFSCGVYEMVGEWLVLCPVYVLKDVAERYSRALSARSTPGRWPV